MRSFLRLRASYEYGPTNRSTASDFDHRVRLGIGIGVGNQVALARQVPHRRDGAEGVVRQIAIDFSRQKQFHGARAGCDG